jgi:hypothetical protein
LDSAPVQIVAIISPLCEEIEFHPAGPQNIQIDVQRPREEQEAERVIQQRPAEVDPPDESESPAFDLRDRLPHHEHDQGNQQRQGHDVNRGRQLEQTVVHVGEDGRNRLSSFFLSSPAAQLTLAWKHRESTFCLSTQAPRSGGPADGSSGGSADQDATGDNQRTRQDCGAVAVRLADDLAGFAGDCRLVDKGHPIDDFPVGGDDLTLCDAEHSTFSLGGPGPHRKGDEDCCEQKEAIEGDQSSSPTLSPCSPQGGQSQQEDQEGNECDRHQHLALSPLAVRHPELLRFPNGGLLLNP